MQILYTVKNIFDLPVSEDEAVCVTTNGMVKKNGHAVMGAGIAKEADARFHLSAALAGYLKAYGNHAFYMGVHFNDVTDTPMSIITFPTKHDWRNDSDLNLIRQSAAELVNICNGKGIEKCYLTPVGCANGHLDWTSQVYPVLCPVLDDRFTVVMRTKAPDIM